MSDNGHVGHAGWIHSALDRFEGPLTRYAHQITHDAERARDVVQETFLTLCRENNASQIDGHLAEWLFTVCRNKALDVRRKESRMTTLAETELAESKGSDSEPTQAAEQRDDTRRITELLGRLPENQQETIRLKFQNSLSYREIAEVTGLTVSNVGFLIHSGLKTIRRQMKPRWVSVTHRVTVPRIAIRGLGNIFVNQSPPVATGGKK